MIDTHQIAPTQFVEANGTRFAYRRFGKTGGVPLVFNMHFTGTMDHWDPAVTDGLAKERQIILFDNAGVSSSSGEVPTTIEEMGANAVAFIKALGLKQVDVLGFSIGGLVAQEITLQARDLVRRLVLVGTGPRSGESMDTGTPEGQRIFGATYEEPDDLWLSVFFTPSQASQAVGREFLKRFRLRTKDRDPEVNDKVAPAQRSAIAKWGAKRERPYDIPISRTLCPSCLDVPVGKEHLGCASIEATPTPNSEENRACPTSPVKPLSSPAPRAAWAAPAHSRSLRPAPKFSCITAAARKKPRVLSPRYAKPAAERTP
jgi:pimeloyl-ACP methyl ester carboxylesterase